MTNAELQALVDHYGGPEYVIGIFFDNPGGTIINYPTTPKWTSDEATSDVVLKTVGGVDVVEIAHMDRTLAGSKGENGTWFIVCHPTEHIQRVAFMNPNGDPALRSDKPQETKIFT